MKRNFIKIISGFAAQLNAYISDNITSHIRYFSEFGNNSVLNILKKICFELDLELINRKNEHPYATGKVNGHTVSIRSHAEDNPGLLELRSIHSAGDGWNFRIRRSLSKENVTTGDKIFDDTMSLWTPKPAELIAILNHETRKAIIDLAEHTYRLVITNYSITVIKPKPSPAGIDELIYYIREMASVSEYIDGKYNIEELLLNNIMHDPEPAVVITNIKSLVETNNLDVEIKKVLKKKLDDTNIEIQIEAAKNLGDIGMKHLVKILEKDAYTSEDNTEYILDILGKNRYEECLEILQKIYRDNSNFKIKAAVIKAFHDIGNSKTSSFLIEELQSAESDLTKIIIEALGTCGSVEAVEPLHIIKDKYFNPFITNEIQKTIAQIQSRLKGADAGWLSVDDPAPEDGALSVTDDAGEGALSMKKKSNKESKKNRKGSS